MKKTGRELEGKQKQREVKAICPRPCSQSVSKPKIEADPLIVRPLFSPLD